MKSDRKEMIAALERTAASDEAHAAVRRQLAAKLRARCRHAWDSGESALRNHNGIDQCQICGREP